ncbi:complex I intermediate-associated protein 30, mitochondrial-like [Centruroides sculpturatus]|uniref:complex I intermediate-associated protein 30, mitochondrial-like n=1 Tax=Centruroides sculpturatus TaxID=218467 RepID=UPI000C6D3D7B|nr:complex I intermediate-associated protein 30, mitochondrial-like [Centruroides sculpturatus]
MMITVNILQKCLISRSTLQRFAPGIVILSTRNFWERDIRQGRRSRQDKSRLYYLKEGLKVLKEEIKVWKDEVIEKFYDDPQHYIPGETKIVWTFDTQENLDKWIPTCDKDNEEGFSECSFTLTKNRRGLFSGVLSNKVPKDGRVNRSGYCNIRSIRATKSFKRDTHLDWEVFTHLVLRVRGDGRSYLLNISTAGYFDVTWYDIYHYVLFTRGGPYWQTVKIPFSKFILASKGRIQDKQVRIPLNRIASLGITCAGDITGSFHLEIDYIGLYWDKHYKEEFAYEMYQVPPYVIGS